MSESTLDICMRVVVSLSLSSIGDGVASDAELEGDVTVDVTRSGGTATDGTDHTTIGTQVLTFADGVMNGATQTASFDVINETIVELDDVSNR